jgi:hypothetical protein
VLAYRVYCERLAGQSLTAREALVEFDADGVSGPLSEEVAEYLLGIPGFEAREPVEVEDAEPEPIEVVSEFEEVLPVEEGHVTEESAFLRWFYSNEAAERVKFIESENLKREELLRVLEEERVTGWKYPAVLAAIARCLFNLRRRFWGKPEEETPV